VGINSRCHLDFYDLYAQSTIKHHVVSSTSSFSFSTYIIIGILSTMISPTLTLFRYVLDLLIVFASLFELKFTGEGRPNGIDSSFRLNASCMMLSRFSYLLVHSYFDTTENDGAMFEEEDWVFFIILKLFSIVVSHCSFLKFILIFW